MRTTTTVIVGAGQAGLAMSRCLTDRSIDHVVLERGQVANSWRTERWDSLRLLTPNWMTRLPGGAPDVADPHGFMTARETVAMLDRYATSVAAPVIEGVTVEWALPLDDGGFDVVTDQGTWRCRTLVVASGAFSDPHVPALASDLPADVQQVSSVHYRNPDQIEDGRILVVGGSSSGAQIADELARAGRDVTLATGEHVRLPRTYRGMDIHWWMDSLGLHDERYDEVDDIARARRVPSLQLVGSPERRDIGLNELAEHGVALVGRLAGLTGTHAQFSGSLAHVATSADLKMRRLLDRVDTYVEENGLAAEVAPPDPPRPTSIPAGELQLGLGDLGAVVWATGFRPRYPWLPDHVLDRKGALVHDGGVVAHPGLYVLGLPFLRRRKSSFIDGVGPDAAELADHLVAHLAGVGQAPDPTRAIR